MLPVASVLPVSATDLIHDILGISSTMDTFVGRQEVKPEEKDILFE